MIDIEKYNNDLIASTLLPYAKQNIKCTIESNNHWLTVRDVCVHVANFLFLLASICSFSSTSYPEYNLGFTAGIINILALKLKALAYLASKNNHLKTIQTNELFKNVGLNISLPDDYNSGIELENQTLIDHIGNKEV
jgi:hypothetical protein